MQCGYKWRSVIVSVIARIICSLSAPNSIICTYDHILTLVIIITFGDLLMMGWCHPAQGQSSGHYVMFAGCVICCQWMVHILLLLVTWWRQYGWAGSPAAYWWCLAVTADYVMYGHKAPASPRQMIPLTELDHGYKGDQIYVPYMTLPPRKSLPDRQV